MRITPVQLAKRIETWGKRLAPLGVAHFEIREIVLGDECPWGDSKRDANASVWTSAHYDVCRFFFSEDFVKGASAYELDQTICHEWIHVAMRDHDEAVASPEDYMSSASFGEWNDRVLHEREGLVDRLATTLVNLHLGLKPRFSPHQ